MPGEAATVILSGAMTGMIVSAALFPVLARCKRWQAVGLGVVALGLGVARGRGGGGVGGGGGGGRGGGGGGIRSQPQALILTAGTEADVMHAPTLLESVDARHVLMDKAYDSDVLRELIASKGVKSCVPPRRNRVAPATYELYKKRHRMKKFFENQVDAPRSHAL